MRMMKAEITTMRVIMLQATGEAHIQEKCKETDIVTASAKIKTRGSTSQQPRREVPPAVEIRRHPGGGRVT